MFWGIVIQAIVDYLKGYLGATVAARFGKALAVQAINLNIPMLCQPGEVRGEVQKLLQLLITECKAMPIVKSVLTGIFVAFPTELTDAIWNKLHQCDLVPQPLSAFPVGVAVSPKSPIASMGTNELIELGMEIARL